ncbi:hypothetical protein [Mycobacterium sp.]|uniref:hypothetical protein n=1 Tax=Mycobacterium sp. TaxID=1785 RepID=UPI003BAFD307
MSRRNATEQIAREERVSKIRQCRRCHPCGWLLDTDGTPIEPAIRCTHGARPPVFRDITAPIHEREFDSGSGQPELDL